MNKISTKILLLLCSIALVSCSSSNSSKYFHDIKIVHLESTKLLNVEEEKFEKIIDAAQPQYIVEAAKAKDIFMKNLEKDIKKAIREIKPNVIGKEINYTAPKPELGFTITSTPKIIYLDDMAKSAIISFNIKTTRAIDSLEVFSTFINLTNQVVSLNKIQIKQNINNQITPKDIELECMIKYDLLPNDANVEILNNIFSMDSFTLVSEDEFRNQSKLLAKTTFNKK